MIIEHKKIKEIGTVTKGVRLSEKDRCDKNGEEVKILTYPNLKKLVDKQSIDDVPTSLINISKKYKRDDIFIKQHDIIIPTFNSKTLYIESDIPKNYIFNETIFILRVNETENITSEYVYMLLSSDYFSNYMRETATVGTMIQRLTKDRIDNMTIPILDKNSMIKLLDEYSHIKKLDEEIKQKHIEFNNTLEKLNTQL